MSTIESEERTFQTAANGLVGAFFVLLKIALVHDMNNRAVGPAMVRFRMSLEQLLHACGETAALQFVGDGVYVNQRLIRADLDIWEKARFIKEFFARFNVAEIAFQGEVPEGSVREFISTACQAINDPFGGRPQIRGTFSGIGFRDLDAVGAQSQDEALVLPDPISVLRAFGVIVVTTRELLLAIRKGERAPMLPLRRAMQEFVRLPRRTSSLQLSLLALEEYRGILEGRLARVGVTVVMMGQRLGLKVAALRELGVSSILAGVGRVFGDDLALAPVENTAAAGLLLKGARRLVASSGVSQGAALRLIASSELGNAEGWRSGHPISRMLAVVESYEQLTAQPPAGGGRPPHDALRQITSSQEFDPASARLLLNTLGLFPVGSMVKLSTGELGIVTEGSAAERGTDEPQVIVLADSGGRVSRGRKVDLHDSGVDIVGTVSADDMDLNVGHFLFA